MATYQHFEMAEHEERSVSRRIAAGKKHTEATGSRETVKYTGPWADMLALMESQTGGDGVEVSCDLERLGGGIGELRITREEYRVPDSDQGEEGEEEPDGGGEAELGSEGAPCLTCSSSPVVVSLLVHPKFVGMGDMERRALKAMIDGQDEHSLIELDETGANGAPVYGKIRDCIKSDAALKAFSYVARGVVEYMDFSTEATLRWKGRSEKYQNGEIVKSLPGRRGAQQGRDWICVGTGIEVNGAEVWSTASFRLSGAGGWDAYLYS